MATTPNTNRIRIGGSGFTVFSFGGQLITFCQEVQHTTPSFVGSGAQSIQPLDEPYPVEIITPMAAGPGTLVLNLLDLFGKDGTGSKVWDRLGAKIGGSLSNPYGSTGINNTSDNLNVTGGVFQGLVDIVDLAIAQAQLDPSSMQIVKYERPLPVNGNAITPATEEYHGCVIVDVRDDEDIQVGTLSIIKQITVNYRFMTRSGKQSAAFKLRDAAI